MKLVIVVALFLSFFLSLATAGVTNYGNPGPTATLAAGVINGVSTTVPGSPVTVNKFLGVPYAARPERFSPPKPVEPWSTPYNASAYRPACIQQFNYPAAARERTIQWFNTPPPPGGESEDCLNLNIYAPASRGKKAVMFWIHGGSLRFGSGSVPFYDGSILASSQDVVVVTINYRTNVFGFPGSPQLNLTEENLGFLDQRLALAWTKANIASFGGDPSRIMIFGESAGSGSVDAMLTSYLPPNPPPFHAAIMQSGQYSIYAEPVNYTESWNKLAAAVNCGNVPDPLACMREVDASVLKDNEERLMLTFPFITDNHTYYGKAAEPNRIAGNVARVPTMGGSNADEGSIFTLAFTDTQSFLRTMFANNEAIVNAILAAYPIGSPGISTEREQIVAISTDYTFQCTAAVVANDTKTGGVPSYRYYYNASFPNTELFPGAGVFHSSEIVSVFGTYPQNNATREQIALSNLMQRIWANFAKDPYSGPGWSEVPTVGVFENTGVRQVSSNTIDGVGCEIFKAIYSMI